MNSAGAAQGASTVFQRVSAISAGGDLDSAGAIYCWGGNGGGELGDGTNTSSLIPVAVDTTQLPAGTVFTQPTASVFHTCALTAVGGAYCWGSNGWGELGDNSTAGSTRPVAVYTAGALAGKNITQIVASGEFDTCALDSAAAAFCWGNNDFGQLGIGSTTSSSVPAPVNTGGVLAGKTLTRLAAGQGFHTCALDSAGAAYCWGSIGTANARVPEAVNTGGAGQEWTTENDGTIQINGKCLDIYRESNANNTPVELWTCTGKANQQWQLIHGTLVNPGSGKCLDDPGSNTTDGTQLDIFTCDGGANQQWSLP